MFEVFRRNQKKWLAALTILAMFAFCFDGCFRGYANRNREQQKDVALEDARMDRQVANLFLIESMAAVGNFMAQQFPQYVVLQQGFGPDGLYGSGSEQTTQSIRDSIRMKQKAEELGITVTDAMVQDWITQVTEGKLTQQQFQQIVRRLARGGRDITAQTLFEILRQQLRIQRVRELAVGRFYIGSQITPYEAWQFFRRLNEKVALEAIPVPVASFTDRIEEPAEPELRKIYDQYVTRLPDPSLPEPGFKEPRRLDLQYAFASLDDFTLALKPELTVTPEEIKEYYESNKERYRVLPSLPERMPEDTGEGTPETETPQDQTPKNESGEEQAPEKGTPDQPADQEAPSKSGPQPLENDAPEPKAEQSPTENSGSKLEKDSEPDLRDVAGDPGQEQPGQDSSAQPDTTAPAGAQESQRPVENAASTASRATDQPPQEPAQEKTEESEEPGQPKKEEAPQYRPLEAVASEIEDRLIRDKARAALLARLEQVQGLVNAFADQEYLTALMRHEEETEQKPGKKFVPPTPPDYSKEISELGLEFAQTGPVTAEEISKTPILGESVESVGEAPRSVAEMMFGSSADDLYDPHLFKSPKDEYLLVWKTNDQPEREPLFPEIREKVLAAYRMIQARDLAREHAEALAGSLREAGGDYSALREHQAEVEPVSIPELPLWSIPLQLSPNSLGAPTRVEPTELPNLRLPGEAFRQLLFSMKEGEVQVAANQPQDTYYVIRVQKRVPADLEEFARSRTLIEQQLQTIRMREVYSRWLDELRGHQASAPVKAPAAN
jgi:hypothetical protein